MTRLNVEPDRPYRLLPHAGLPLYFTLEGISALLRSDEGLPDDSSFKDIYWDIRPRPDFGTIEFRIRDIPLTLTETLRIVALRAAWQRPACVFWQNIRACGEATSSGTGSPSKTSGWRRVTDCKDLHPHAERQTPTARQ